MEFKVVKGAEHLEVSSNGVVRTRAIYVKEEDGSFLKVSTEDRATQFAHTKTDKWYISTYVGGKQVSMYVHKLVAAAFIPNPHDLKSVAFIDGNVNNITASNLVWTKGRTSSAIQSAIKMKELYGNMND